MVNQMKSIFFFFGNQLRFIYGKKVLKIPEIPINNGNKPYINRRGRLGPLGVSSARCTSKFQPFPDGGII